MCHVMSQLGQSLNDKIIGQRKIWIVFIPFNTSIPSVQIQYHIKWSIINIGKYCADSWIRVSATGKAAYGSFMSPVSQQYDNCFLWESSSIPKMVCIRGQKGLPTLASPLLASDVHQVRNADCPREMVLVFIPSTARNRWKHIGLSTVHNSWPIFRWFRFWSCDHR